MFVHALRQAAHQFIDGVFSLEVASWLFVFTCVLSFSCVIFVSFAVSWNFCFFFIVANTLQRITFHDQVFDQVAT